MDLASLIDHTQDSQSSNDSFKDLSNFWDTKQRGFNIFIKDKEDSLNTKQQAIDNKIARYGEACEASKAAFNKEIGRMKSMFQKKTDDALQQIHDTSLS